MHCYQISTLNSFFSPVCPVFYNITYIIYFWKRIQKPIRRIHPSPRLTSPDENLNARTLDDRLNRVIYRYHHWCNAQRYVAESLNFAGRQFVLGYYCISFGRMVIVCHTEMTFLSVHRLPRTALSACASAPPWPVLPPFRVGTRVRTRSGC